jgi:choline dehydrogenase-like flavoprotein
MAATPDQGVVSPDCESWELRNLFLADASVFPTSLGRLDDGRHSHSQSQIQS